MLYIKSLPGKLHPHDLDLAFISLFLVRCARFSHYGRWVSALAAYTTVSQVASAHLARSLFAEGRKGRAFGLSLFL